MSHDQQSTPAQVAVARDPTTTPLGDLSALDGDRDIASQATTDVPVLDPDRTAGQIRGELIGHTYRSVRDLPVCHDGRLVGIVRVEDLLGAPSHTRIAAIMDTQPPTIPHDTDRELAAWHAVQHEESSLALIDADGRFHGIVPPDRLLDVLLREHEQDLARLGGYQARTEPARLTSLEPIHRRLAHRLPWLLIGLAGAIASAGVVGWFEHRLRTHLTLALFIPGIVYLANAVGTQTEILVVRGLSVGVSIRDIARRELTTGLLAGMLLALVLLPTALLLWHDTPVAITVALTVAAAAAAAAIIAIALPFLLDRAGTDPAFGSGPLATIVQDLLSLVIYFAIATVIIT